MPPLEHDLLDRLERFHVLTVLLVTRMICARVFGPRSRESHRDNPTIGCSSSVFNANGCTIRMLPPGSPFRSASACAA